MRRFFVPDISAEQVTLPDDEARHAAAALRLDDGSEVELFDGRGAVAAGRIVRQSRREVAVAIDRRLPVTPRPGPAVHLAFAVPKGKRLDWLLEKATELGAASLQAVVFQRSVAGGDKPGEIKLANWQGHCVAAAKQCGLNWLPQLRPAASLAEYLAGPCEHLRLIGDADETAATLAAALVDWPPARDIQLLVGPEGGLTDAELQAARDAGLRFVRLGHTTLRIETAAIALLAALTAIAQER